MIYLQGIRQILPFLICLSCFSPCLAQPTLDADLKKPAKYENRILRAEKTGEKKFTIPRRFFQNTYTHFNYAFNAQYKLTQVVENAKLQHVDHYAELLSFYNYTIENTSAQKTELDSVIFKVNSGVFLHDLRSDWMDNIYLLMGQAYYYRNTLDTAFMTFQYMNYAFSPKEADGYDKPIASNANEDGNNLKVATVEKRNLVKKAFSAPPSRNDALVWLIRTHITRNQMGEAGTLIQTLRNDPNFPKRLLPELAEVTAYWFYQTPQFDSAAFYLQQALPAAGSKQEKARWEYLIGQLYSRAGKSVEAKAAFKQCILHTLNPIMEVAAQLQYTMEISGDNAVDWQSALDALDKMARREKYMNYRDLIYYTMAKIEVRRNDLAAAKNHLFKSIKYNTNNPEQKTRSYLLLGELAFKISDYALAAHHYDSVVTSYLAEPEIEPIDERKKILQSVSPFYAVIHRQDSLQKLAALPEAERTAILKKYLRQLRKQQGLKEDEQVAVAGGPVLLPSGNLVATDLFSDNANGEWYFYNNTLKSRGFNEFRTKWGNRANRDNWRRSSSVSNVSFNKETIADNKTVADEVSNLSIETLLSQLPIEPAQLKISNDSILQAQYQLAYALQNKFEDYASAASLYEGLQQRFPGNKVEADVLYNLAICYRKLGKNEQLNTTIGALSKNYPNTRQTKMAIDPAGVQAADSAENRKATATYNTIYNLFIEGHFDEAIAAKNGADSLFGNHYWSPQLLYIQGIYYIRQKQDSLALVTLGQLAAQYPDHVMASKANQLMGVLSRRAEIENYLTNLQIERPADSGAVVITEPAIVVKDTVANVLPAISKPALAKTQAAADSSRLKKGAPVLPAANLFTRHAEQPHFVVLVLDQVDPVYVNEARNAFIRYNKERYYNQPMNVVIVELSAQVKLVSISGLANEKAAMDYLQEAKIQAPKDIIPWLKGNKYYFLPIAQDNMDLLISNKNLPAYRDFMHQLFPDLQ
jgi:tetratricopeptide (TPR) repeat protein